MSWPLVMFDDVANVVTGSTPKKNSDNYGSEVPFVTPGDMGKVVEVCESRTMLTKKGAESARLLPVNSVLVCCIGATIGKVGIAKKNLVTNQQINSLVFDELKVYPKFGYYFCATLTPLLKDMSSSTTMPIVNKSRFSEIEIPLPPIKEQKRIAAILDKADGLRRKRQQANELANEFLRAVFLDIFGDPIINTKGWPKKSWGQVIKIINGRNQKQVEEVDGQYPIYGSGGEMSRASDYLCNENTIIIGRKGNINKPILVTEKFWNVDTAFGLEADSMQLTYQYLYWFCKFFNFERLNKTVTIPSLTKSDLLEIMIPLPKMEVQAEFINISAFIERLLKKFNASESEGDDLFESVSQKAFAGEL